MNDLFTCLGFVLLLSIVGGFIALIIPRRITVYEYQRGLKYVHGKFKQALPPNQYWTNPLTTLIKVVDIRPRFSVLKGQEILTQDGITLKISLVVQYKISNSELAVNSIENYEEALYLESQLALRDVIIDKKADELLTSKAEIEEAVFELSQPKFETMGLKLLTLKIRDMMFPGNLKHIFAQIVLAQKEGQAILEKARAETAALRHLANAAKMLDKNPSLMQLRVLQTLNQTTGNKIVLDMSPSTEPKTDHNQSNKNPE